MVETEMMEKMVYKTLAALAFLLLVIATASGSAQAQQPAANNASETVRIDQILQYLDDMDEVESRVQYATARIQSRQELQQYLDGTVVNKSPLGRLSAAARQTFLSSLRFNEKGLTSFRYDVLEDNLTPTEIYTILRLFGAQQTVPMMQAAHAQTNTDMLLLIGGHGELDDGKDHKDYRCVSRATCKKAMRYICTSNC